MSELAEMIERVVREVLAGLGHTVAAAPAQPSGPAPQNEEANDSLVLNRRLVTLADLPDRFAAARRVIVPPGTVVTPSARDELRRKRIELVVGATAAVAAQRTSSAILMVAATVYDPAPLAAALQRDGVAAESRSSDCLIRATDELAAELASGTTTAILLTAYPAPALCLANRHAGVQAIHGTGADTVARDAGSVGANLLVIDPTSLGFFAVKQIAGRFLQGGPRECPEVFRKRLGL